MSRHSVFIIFTLTIGSFSLALADSNPPESGSALIGADLVSPKPGNGGLIAAKGDAAAGLTGTPVAGALFNSFGPPTVSQTGDVAFHAFLKAPPHAKAIPASENNGIWLYRDNGAQFAIARTGDVTNPAPNSSGAPFTKLSDPVMSTDGTMIFLGSFAGGGSHVAASTGIFLFRGDGLTRVLAAGDPAPGVTGGTFVKFEEAAAENARGFAVLAMIKGAGISAKNNLGIWATDGSGVLQLVAQTGEPLPDGGATPPAVTGFTAFAPLKVVSGQSRTVDTIDGNLVFLAKAKSPSVTIVGAENGAGGFTVGKIGGVGGTVPGLPDASIKSLDEPVANENKTIAFLGTLAGKDASGEAFTAKDNAAIGIRLQSSQASVAARTGSTVAPDQSGSTTAGALYSKLSDPVLNNNDQYAFIASLAPGIGDTAKNGSNGGGIWTNVSGSLERAVRKGDTAPGTSGKFATFEQLALADIGGPIFTAKLSGVPAAQAQGLWEINRVGALQLILQAGNTLDVHGVNKIVKSFKIFQTPNGVMGQSRSFDATSQVVAYEATFTDGTTGVFNAFPRVSVCGWNFDSRAVLFANSKASE